MLLQRVTDLLHKKNLLSTGDTVIVGFSGGADSTALLHLLKSANLNLRLIAVYINHGLRSSEIAYEERFTQNFATGLNIEYITEKIDVLGYQKIHGFSIEEAARNLRYAALEKIHNLYEAQAIAVAHTADDQVEEFLIRTIRGSGSNGLSGMSYKNNHIIRPLLAESKSTLLDYIESHGLTHCHDSSNDDRSFLRNRVRLDLLPYLEKSFNPSIRTNILQTTEIIRQEDNLLNDLASDIYRETCTINENIPRKGKPQIPPISIHLDRTPFTASHSALQRRILETICWEMQSRPAFRQLVQLQSLIEKGANGAKMHLPDGLRVQLNKGTVIFSHPAGRKKIRGDKTHPVVVEQKIRSTGIYPFLEINKQLTINFTQFDNSTVPPVGTLYINENLVSFPLTVRLAEPGEKMRPLGAPGKKKISRILNDLKIVTEERNRYPLLLINGEIAAILGAKIADRFKCTAEDKRCIALKWESFNTTTSNKD